MDLNDRPKAGLEILVLPELDPEIFKLAREPVTLRLPEERMHAVRLGGAGVQLSERALEPFRLGFRDAVLPFVFDQGSLLKSMATIPFVSPVSLSF